MNDDQTYKRIVTYSDGQQILIQDAPGISVSIDFDDLDIVKEQRIDHIDQVEYEALAQKAMTHDLKVDTIGGNISVIPKETPTDMPTDLQTDTPKTPEAE